MKDIHLYNCQIFERFKAISLKDNLSCPLLVSPKITSPKKVMYIGQETNTWINNYQANYSVETIEDEYYNFLKQGAVNSEYWRFITDILSIDKKDIINNILWCNCLLAGKKGEAGTPTVNDQLIKLSIEYLTTIYEIYNPTNIIIVCGPNNPYYKIVTSFLENIGLNIDDYPKTNENICLHNEKVFWTYHPNYLNRKHENSSVKKFIREKI